MHTSIQTHTERYVLRTSTPITAVATGKHLKSGGMQIQEHHHEFGYTLLGKPGIGLCVPPNIESNVETDHRPKPNPFVDSPVAMERIKD